MQTSAVVFTQQEKAVVQRLQMPAPGAGEVQVRTAYSSISSGTEDWVFRNRFTWAKTPFPCVPGYQRVGVITAVGPGVEGWREGERVMATTGQWAGSIHSFWGSHLALANTPVEQLFHLPEGIDEISASAAVVAQVGYNAASRAVIDPGDWVVVYGDGLVGQCVAQAARARGAKVILVGHRAERLELAAEHSADAVLNSRTSDVVNAVRGQTGGECVRVVFDTIQGEAVQRQYLPLLEHGRGQIVYSGFTPDPTWADMGLLQQRELTTHFVSGWNRTRMEATLGLMAAGKMKLRPLVTHLVPYDRGPDMYAMIRGKSEPFLGVTLDWTGDDACES